MLPGYTPSSYLRGQPSVAAIQEIGFAEVKRCFKYFSQFILNQNRAALCQGQSIRPPLLEASLSCQFLDQKDPYLQLGPFKLEILSAEPFVGRLHQAHYDEELEDIKASSRGKMKATPLLIHAKESSEEASYTSRRTSKVKSNVQLKNCSTTLLATGCLQK